MSEPRLASVTCASPAGFHRMAYWEWGDPQNPRVLLCVHGLMRTGRDFDRLARCLTDEYRIVCPDLVGRGQSDWLTQPSLYTVPQYVADLTTLIAHLRPKTLHWVGTSLGGLIGMALGGGAALSARHRAVRSGEQLLRPEYDLSVDKLVLNDVGPRINPPSLLRLGQTIMRPAEFATHREAMEDVREACAPFGPHTDEQWDELARYTIIRDGNLWRKHYDPGIAVPFGHQNPITMAAGEQVLWHSYDALACPVLLLRGEHSDLLTSQTADEMLRRNHHARRHEVDGVGHAPTLMHDTQIEPVIRFLLEADPDAGSPLQ